MRMRVAWISSVDSNLLMPAYDPSFVLFTDVVGIHPFAKRKVEEMGGFSKEIDRPLSTCHFWGVIL
jgi:hypothetical protein